MRAHVTTCSKELLQDIFSQKFLPGLIQGLIVGAILVIVEVSFASIIFSGPLASFATPAAGMCIFGAGALSLATGLFSPFSNMVSLPQDTPVAILSVAAVAIVAALPSAPAEVMFATVSATIMTSAFITALFFWLIGKFKLSNFARFLPFPVIGGFLAGSGAMLLLGSFGVMTDTALTAATFSHFLTLEMFIHWAPGVFFALAVFFLMRIKPHFLVLPVSILAGGIIFFLIVLVSGDSIAEIRAQGWLPALMPAGQLWPAFTAETAGKVDWQVLITQIPNILTVALLSLVGMILNINGIELGVHQDIDLDHELEVEAAGNLVAGLGGGFAGYSTLSLSMLGPRSNTITRIIPVTAALVCLAVLFFGGEALVLIPKPLLGGLLFLLGFFFLEEWLFSGWKRLTPTDYLIVLVIVLTIVNQGFLQGIGLGFALTVVIFIVRFTRIPVILSQETLTTLHSTRQRSIPDQILLARKGQSCIVLKLSGYLFFGSTYFVGKRVKELLEGENRPEHIILDLSKIQGFDISAMITFQRIAQQARAKGVTVALVSASNRLLELIRRNSSPEVMKQLSAFSDLDDALESQENQLLAKHLQILTGKTTDGITAREDLFDAAVDDLDAQLLEQERFEGILAGMAPYLTEKTFSPGEILVAEGEEPEGIIFVLLGSVALVMTDDTGKERRLSVLRPGGVIAPAAAWGSYRSPYTARAEHQGIVAIIPATAIAKMEEEAPATAMLMYKYITEILHKTTITTQNKH